MNRYHGRDRGNGRLRCGWLGGGAPKPGSQMMSAKVVSTPRPVRSAER